MVDVLQAYNPDNIKLLTMFVTDAYDSYKKHQTDSEIINFHARAACEIAVLIRKYTEIDLCRLTFVMEDPPLSPTHPIMKVLPFLEEYIVGGLAQFKERSDRDGDQNEKLQRVATYSRMQAASVWKSYLFTLNTPLPNLFDCDIYGLSSLRILSLADARQVIASLRDATRSVDIEVNDSDWPPQAFLSFYLRHGKEIERRLVGTLIKREGSLESLKALARRNSLDDRLALEISASATADEKSERAKNLRTVDAVTHAYSTMKREDFCETVAISIRAGNLSENDATTALYFCEWAASQADLRISFPEWLPVEGEQRFAMLTDKWLGNDTNKSVSFNSWLAGRYIQ